MDPLRKHGLRCINVLEKRCHLWLSVHVTTFINIFICFVSIVNLRNNAQSCEECVARYYIIISKKGLHGIFLHQAQLIPSPVFCVVSHREKCLAVLVETAVRWTARQSRDPNTAIRLSYQTPREEKSPRAGKATVTYNGTFQRN